MQVSDKLQNVSTALENKARSTQGKGGELGKADFLNLFMHQMSHQNPLDPMDSSKMMTQMSQLGSMEQLQLLNQEMKTLNDGQSTLARLASSRLLGKEVSFGNNDLKLNEGVAAPISFNIDKNVDQMNVKVSDHTGLVMANVDLGQKTAGTHEFVWNGKNNKGEAAPNGKYSVAFSAYDNKGKSLEVNSNQADHVEEIRFVNGQAMLKVGGRLRSLDEVEVMGTGKTDNLFSTAQPMPLYQSLKTK